MNNFFITLLCCLVTSLVTAQIPEWYQAEMERKVGTWVANNNEYMSEQETDNAYALRWEWGVGKTSLIGTLYGMHEGVTTNEYWQFLEFWDSEKEKVRVIQISGTGVVGEGYIEPVSTGKTKLLQTFKTPTGQTYQEGHRTQVFPDYELSTSYQIKGEKWVEGRTYTWYKE